ncbi:lecithin retinol acyltransferase family protein [Helicobacter bizzozeronii]|uniref:lecithin retinol acyltransferase family protein n=1 Tax=Helicobacter bizzozeronii TaxID=56877 RepID=UPI000CEEE5D5|nr:lecithin retinol acyltransferase family protein [Helicobacter bizzozeronii]
MIPIIPILTGAAALFVGSAATQVLYESFIDEFPTYDDPPVGEPDEGSVLWCHLWGNLSHTGIYVGGGKIIHLTGKTNDVPCEIEGTNADNFRDGWKIYVSCKGKNAVGSKRAAQHAKKCEGEKRQYNLLEHNCHGFVVECLTGVKQSEVRARKPAKETAEHTGMDCWRRWDL